MKGKFTITIGDITIELDKVTGSPRELSGVYQDPSLVRYEGLEGGGI